MTEHLMLEVENVLGLHRATMKLPYGHVTEVEAPNASGKTSLATVLTALLLREKDPLGFGRGRTEHYRRRGAEEGSWRASLKGPGMDITWSLERDVMASNLDTDPDSPLHRRSHAAFAAALGHYRFDRAQKDKARADMLADLFGEPELDLESVREAVTAADDTVFRELLHAWMLNEGPVRRDRAKTAEGWARARAREAKRDWEKTTGERYGSSKANGWQPKGARDPYLSADRIDVRTQEELERAVRAAEIHLQSVSNARAVTRDQRRRYEEGKALRKDLEARIAEEKRMAEPLYEPMEEANRELSELRDNLEKASDRLGQVKWARDTVAECPVCGALLSLRNRKLEEYSELSLDELDERYEEAYEYDEQFRELVKEQEQKVRGLEGGIQAAKERVAELERTLAPLTWGHDIGDRPVAEEEDLKREEEAKAALEAERNALAQRAIADQARDLHTDVTVCEQLARALSPDSEHWVSDMHEQRSRFDLTLLSLHVKAGWPLVEMDEDGVVTVGDMPVQSCSASERWIAQAACMIGASRVTGLDILVLDGADILDRAWRAALDRILLVCAGSGMCVLVCGTGSGERSRHSAISTWAIRDGVLMEGGE